MTMIKGSQGGTPTLDSIDLTHATTLECEECGCQGFKQTLILKKLSALMSPSGQEAMIPIQVFACTECSHVNKGFQPKDVTGKLPKDS